MMPKEQYYAQYLYGRLYKTTSPRSEALGEALCVLFDIADSARQRQVVAHTPVTGYGIPCIYPQIPGIPPYHNNAVWPFVQSFWLWAAAKTANEKMVMESIGAIYRPAALFVTNKENFVADNGDYSGTEINSGNMLWSLSGSISIVHKVLFGIVPGEAGLSFSPFVPRNLKGPHRLSNYKYRDMVLDIELEGWGNRIKSFSIDGEQSSEAALPATLSGSHHIRIVLSDSPPAAQPIHKTANYTAPATPVVSLSNNQLSWKPVDGAVRYQITGNGKPIDVTTVNEYPVNESAVTEYQVVAVDANGIESFASEPVIPVRHNRITTYPLGKGSGDFLEISTVKNRHISLPVTISQPGRYALDFRYANGNGPVNTENKCAIRSMKIDGIPAGTFVFPQRGKDTWDDRGFSNALMVNLTGGTHQISLNFEPWNENMNGAVNQARLDYLRMIRID